MNKLGQKTPQCAGLVADAVVAYTTHAEAVGESAEAIKHDMTGTAGMKNKREHTNGTLG